MIIGKRICLRIAKVNLCKIIMRAVERIKRGVRCQIKLGELTTVAAQLLKIFKSRNIKAFQLEVSIAVQMLQIFVCGKIKALKFV